MGCCDEPATALAVATTDPTQHVNYAKGMVLGVDDFTQEFAYLAGRTQWLARETVGYGTTSGLRVWVEESGADGPRLHVGAGTALVPSGRLVCVGADQCATLNKWLAKRDNAALVTQLLNPAMTSPPMSSPPVFSPPLLSPPAVTSGPIALYLTLCYSDCPTRPVPIPGEPCRSSDELMENSRVADDFRLELRGAPPKQVEEDALRDFERWLRANVSLGGGTSPSSDEAAWLDALRSAAGPWLAAASGSPPPSPPPSFETLGDYLFDLSPPGITVGTDVLCDFVRVAFRFWITELRPMWMAMRCHRATFADIDCVLLARVEFDVVWVGGSPVGAWQVAGSPPVVTIDERTRPLLVHSRLLQEWTLCAGALAGAEAGGSDILSLVEAPRLPVVRTSTNLTLGANHGLIVGQGAGPLTLTLPTSDAFSIGRVYVVTNANVASLTIAAAPGEQIGSGPTTTVAIGKAVSVASVGSGQWRIISTS